jgi:hypothetical protein
MQLTARYIYLLLFAVGATRCAAPPNAAPDAADSATMPSEDAAIDAVSERPPEACMGVPVGFECDENRLRLCDLGEPWRIDCDNPPQGGGAGRCALVSAEHGHACVVPVGAGCRMNVAHGAHSHVFWSHCEGARSGCVVTERGAGFEGACAAEVGTCALDDVDTCRGSRLITRCVRGQPVAYDCAALGGTCSPGACVQLPAGAVCGVGLECRDGLECARANRNALYRCRAPASDAGVDAGSDG